MSIGGRKTSAAWLLFIAILAVAGLTCNWLDELSVRGPVPAEEAEAVAHIRETRAALSLTQLAIQQTQTAEAENEPALPAEAPAEPPAGLPPSAHVPVILDVDFPAVVRVGDSTANGTVWFKDGGRDVNRVSIQTIVGSFPSGSWDPTADLKWAGSEGSTPFQGKCGRAEFVRCVLKLQDAAGNVSEGYTFSFYCQ